MKNVYFCIVVFWGCTTVPPTNIHQPMSAGRPRLEAVGGNGAIYQRPQVVRCLRIAVPAMLATQSQSILLKARLLRLIRIPLDKTNSSKAAVSAFSGLPGKGLLGLDLNGSSSNNFSERRGCNKTYSMAALMSL
jgi:flagellar L-ring protein precursor FlgH